MAPRRPSAQTRLVLDALRIAGREWRHGYDLARATGLAPGTLYPILGRLTDRGLLESRWEEDPPTGRPRRHLYRLSEPGRGYAAEFAAAPVTRAVSTRPGLAGGLA
ncbi:MULTISPECIES: PadR family transcriptional regulator [unclassified Nocardia]|uniref:PadR family transcriptional regulator n=1 Tax=unclassified Nocardia TaxID=2637762 RepID=UPI001CE497F2|nr:MULTISPECIES: PadR family transcriptional regulator [unclassified Nocardia]